MRSVTKFYIFTALGAVGFGFVATLYVPYLYEIGLNPAEVMMVNGIFWLVALSFELPTGMIADGRGRGFSITAGALVVGIGAILYVFASGFWGAIVPEILIAIGHAFFSGAINAWIVDAPDRDQDLTHVFGTATAVRGVGTVVSVLIGVQIATVAGAEWCFGLWGLVNLIAFIFALLVMQDGTVERPLKELEVLRLAWHHLVTSPELRFIVALDALSAFYMLINLFWAPLFLARFREIGYGEVELGWMFSAMYVVIVISGYLVRKFKPGRVSHRATLALVVVWVGVVAILFSFTRDLTVWIILILSYEVGWGVFGPLLSAYIHDRVPSEFRATFESIMSFIWSLTVVILTVVATILLWGEEASEIQTLMVWRYTGTVMVLVTAVVWAFRPKKS